MTFYRNDATDVFFSYVDSVLWLGWTAEEKVFVLSIGEVDDVQIQQSASSSETANPNVSLDTKVP